MSSKIAIMTASNSIGGTELSSLRICRVLKQNGKDAVFLTPKTLMMKELDSFGIDYKIYSENRKSVFATVVGLFQLHKMIKSEDIQLIHCQDAWATLLICLLKKIWHPNLKLIWHERSIKPKSYHRMAKFANLIDIVICNSYYEKTLLLFNGYPLEKMTVVYNAIETPKYSSSREKIRQEFNYSSTDYVVGSLGRLTKDKGVEYLIRGAYLANIPNLKLLIVGDGPERRNLEDLVTELNLQDRVTFTGFRRDTADLYRAMDLFTVPSLYEAFGNITVEAMLSRTPVLASHTGGITEVVRDGENGFFAFPGEPENWAEKLQYIYTHQELIGTLVEKAYVEASSKYSFERLFRELSQVYDSLR